MNHYGCLARLSLPKPVGTPCSSDNSWPVSFRFQIFFELSFGPKEIVFLRSPNFLKAMVRGSAVMTGGWSNCSSLGIWWLLTKNFLQDCLIMVWYSFRAMTHLAALKLLMILMMQLPYASSHYRKFFHGKPRVHFRRTDCWFGVEDIDVKIAI